MNLGERILIRPVFEILVKLTISHSHAMCRWMDKCKCAQTAAKSLIVRTTGAIALDRATLRALFLLLNAGHAL